MPVRECGVCDSATHLSWLLILLLEKNLDLFAVQRTNNKTQVVSRSGAVRSRDPARGARAEGASASRCSLAFSLFARLSLGDLGGTISASRPIVFSSLVQALYGRSPCMTYYIISGF